MTAPKWHEGPIPALDTETTGVDPHNDRIVTAAIVHTSPGSRPQPIQWLIHPERDIPAEAAEVHGWTLDRLERALTVDGVVRPAMRIVGNRPPRWLTRDGALNEIAAQAATAIGADLPLVVCNAAFDLTLLEAELTRAGVDTLASRPKGITGVVDPMVLEKQFDPYRRVRGGCKGGKHACGGCGAEDKKLGSLARHYGVRLPGAHEASADALAGIRLAVRLAGLWPEVARWKLGTLHAHQVTWRKEQADSLRQYFTKQGTPHDGICPSWPVHGDGCCSRYPASKENAA